MAADQAQAFGAANRLPEPSPESPEPRPEPVDDLVTTRHTLRTAAGELSYTAQAGRIVMRQEVHTDDVFDGHQPKAEVFLTAYTLDGAEPGTRPVTYAFNGGPAPQACGCTWACSDRGGW
jgi:carboxypeptidase C (cathepsin A)